MDSQPRGLRVPALLRDVFETAIVFLYPSECRVCESFLGPSATPYICDTCWQDIRWLVPPWCDICGTEGISGLCDACAVAPPRYGKLRTVAFYQTTLQHAIHFFKFEKKTAFAPHLVSLLMTHLPSDCEIEGYDFILPVPIHKKRHRERGFNQAALLAKGLGKAVGVPVLTDTLSRHRHTQAQSSLDREARQQNLIGAFEVRHPDRIRGKRLLVFDDVFTTGATIREVVNELWNADPAEVDVLTLARTAVGRSTQTPAPSS